ncbi:MAG: 6-phosphogluconolactonase [Bacteroidota bacterium]|nr:6-phosphogluconolactonase [Bacteroidota bacterium]
MNREIFKDADHLCKGLAEWITSLIEETLSRKDRFSLVLSGGNTPKKLHALLASSPWRERIDWKKIHVFWGDERAVPFDDERNNARMAFDTLLDHVDVPREQIHIMDTSLSPDAAAMEYEEELFEFFETTDLPARTFDLVLLGMGDDGHTLSLFPGETVIHEEKLWVTSYYLRAQEMYRITLTKNIVNHSAHIVFMISGPGKAAALHEVLEGERNPDRFPSQLILPTRGELHFFMDEAAAAKL